MKAATKARGAVRATLGVLLCVAGFVLARAAPFRETTVIVNADGCRVVTDVIDDGKDAVQGSVILLHGLAANKEIMAYLARAFALQNLRVFVPDMPGHGRTPGPFSYGRAESCTNSFVRQLIAGRAIDPAQTVIAGHSMGGALAVRVAARGMFAGVIAISPAPMTSSHGISPSMLLFTDPPATPANTLVLSASWDPRSARDSAKNLLEGDAAATGKYLVIPHSTHVSLLFDPDVARAEQAWASGTLKLNGEPSVPSRLPLAGALAGFGGILVLVGPFLRETLGMTAIGSDQDPGSQIEPRAPSLAIRIPAEINSAWPLEREPGSPVLAPPSAHVVVEIAIASVAAVGLLRLWNPFDVLHVFQGDYLAGFLLILGILILLLHRQAIDSLWHVKARDLVAAAFAAIILPLLIYSWFDLTITEAWLTAARWLRLPALCVVLLPYHAAEELLLGALRARPGKARMALALGFRLAAWCALLAGILLLHNGEILLALLAPYFAVFCLLQRTGMDVVRKGTGSALAAAIFGAILLAGFCVIVFPIT